MAVLGGGSPTDPPLKLHLIVVSVLGCFLVRHGCRPGASSPRGKGNSAKGCRCRPALTNKHPPAAETLRRPRPTSSFNSDTALPTTLRGLFERPMRIASFPPSRPFGKSADCVLTLARSAGAYGVDDRELRLSRRVQPPLACHRLKAMLHRLLTIAGTSIA
jgi:hypothetical protein